MDTVYIAFTQHDYVMGVFRTKTAAIECLVDHALDYLDDADDEDRERVASVIRADGCYDGFGYVETADFFNM